MNYLKKSLRIILVGVLGVVGFFVLLSVLDTSWSRKHEKLAHDLCDAIPIGTLAPVAKERAYAMAKVVAEIEVKELSINLVFLNPYSPGDRISCVANIWDGKIVNNTVWVND